MQTYVPRHLNIIYQESMNINIVSIALTRLGPTNPPSIIVAGETSDIW